MPAWVTGVPASGTGALAINFTVAANTGVARSATINISGQTFTVNQAGGCTFALNPTSYAAPAAGGSRTVDVTTAAGCGWSSSGVPAWVTLAPSSGTGSQTINLTVAATTGGERDASFTIAGQTFTVNQGSGCTFALSPTSYTAPAAGDSSSFEVTTAAGCGWTSSGVPAWITGVPASGTGTQTINFTVAAHSGSARSATINISGQTFTVNQGSGCTFALSPTSYSAPAAGDSSSFEVTTAAGCGWTSSGVPAWITGVPGSGTGTQTINFTVAAHSGSPRSATINISGQTFTVNQGSGCTFALSPTQLRCAGGR